MTVSPLEFLFPRKCPYCGKIIIGDRLECDICRAGFPQKPYIRIIPGGNECVAAFKYDGVVRDAIKIYKFYGKREFCKSFSAALAQVVYEYFGEPDLVTSVPLSKKRLRARGYDQSELIGREVGRLLSVEYMRTLEKIIDNAEQHSLSHEERKSNIIGVYKRLSGIRLNGKTVLIVDDIVTSGYTLSECCRILAENSDVRIICGTVASAF